MATAMNRKHRKRCKAMGTQPLQYTISVLAAWLSLLGVVVFVLLAVVSWVG